MQFTGEVSAYSYGLHFSQFDTVGFQYEQFPPGLSVDIPCREVPINATQEIFTDTFMNAMLATCKHT